MQRQTVTNNIKKFAEQNAVNIIRINRQLRVNY